MKKDLPTDSGDPIGTVIAIEDDGYLISMINGYYRSKVSMKIDVELTFGDSVYTWMLPKRCSECKQDMFYDSKHEEYYCPLGHDSGSKSERNSED